MWTYSHLILKGVIHTIHIFSKHPWVEGESRKGQNYNSALQWSSSERKRTPNIYAILSQKLVMSRFTCFLKGFRWAFSESHPAFRELSTNVFFQRAFWKRNLVFVTKMCKCTLSERTEGFYSIRRKPANHPAWERLDLPTSMYIQCTLYSAKMPKLRAFFESNFFSESIYQPMWHHQGSH